MSAARGLLFPGQGAQAKGMGKALADAHAAARAVFAEADEVLGFSLSKLCFEGPEEELTRTDNAQAAIFVTSVAAVEALGADGTFDRDGITATAGLSLGEYTALWFAGVFSFADGLRLVRLRGEAMQRASDAAPSGMVSLVGADRDKAAEVCDAARGDGVLVVANLNAPGQVVISGDRAACGRAVELARDHGVRRAIALNVAGAFHSPLMAPAGEALNEALGKTLFHDARIPVYSNVTAAPETAAVTLRDQLSRQVTSPVLWEDSVRRMLSDGITAFFEPEPGTVLAGLLRKIDRDAEVTALGAGGT